MRTTIELRSDQRARLLEMAAERGEKGFSRIIQEAVDRYFEDADLREMGVAEALGVLGSLDADEATQFRGRVAKIRRSWR